MIQGVTQCGLSHAQGMAVDSGAQVDLTAHSESVRLPLDVLVKELRELLGARLVAYLGRVQETRAVRQWADGERTPGNDVALRLRTAFHATRVITNRDSPGVAQAWFQGLNPALADRSPASLLRDGDTDAAAVLAAAKAFAATG